MKVTLEIAFSFKRDLGAGETGLDLPKEADVGYALRDLVRRHPSLEQRFFSRRGALHRHVNVLVNGRNVALGEGLATRLSDGDRLTLLPPVGGG